MPCSNCNSYSAFGWVEWVVAAVEGAAKYGPKAWEFLKQYNCTGFNAPPLGSDYLDWFGLGAVRKGQRYYDKDTDVAKFCQGLFGPAYDSQSKIVEGGVDDTRIDWRNKKNENLCRCLIKGSCIQPPNAASGEGLAQRGLTAAAKAAISSQTGGGGSLMASIGGSGQVISIGVFAAVIAAFVLAMPKK